MPTSVALGFHFEEFIKAQLSSGRYNNASEVVREGLRLLEDQEKLRALKLEALRAEIQRGIDGGPGIAAGQMFDELRRRIDEVAAGAAE
ncbi:type II toxin-antitoxin system ParD family antitoxin [Accumulibacter sp.]|jgi:antitoxin ParD1/3/4|uniref:type II toxin-antitoxin system ParD family antitoxin n=1 Tax=Accumulibacter sp. TaxID=2053492 RepID=UPI001ACFA7F6|nr:type II toxin-antitoxin system ParD family antitoxin [Accumulibacter sp.]MBN8453572.1 type II toxin-antitoxin system ParD family antitoxin [Accumulibacter sp.]MBO3706324.1 type II toxin-antitoxin system ParD family antitoxin [Candidatus Accumulibacter conexus]MBO3715801.1 type II toxin-antitoxin system ParD family antitoxin [Accumulibacter sp.]